MIMSDSRTKNATRNIVVGVLYKVVTLLLPFITRTLLLYLLGTASLGVSTLFTSILSFLSLAELGFGAAIVYAMYRPIAENNYQELNALLMYYRKLYRIIGVAILLIGICLIPFLRFLIKGETPENVNIPVLYCMYLFNSVISYFVAGYRQSLLIAYQRTDIRDKIALVITVCVRIMEILSLYLTKNLYVFVFMSIIGTIATNIITAIITKNMYPSIECKGNVSKETRKEISKKLGGLFGTKLNSIVVNQADTIVISAFLGLTMLAQYGNYYYILNAISGFVMIIFSSMTAGIGNKIASDTKEEVYRLFKKINFINNWIVGWCFVCLLCLYKPFMILWVKEELTLPVLMSILIACYFYIYQIQRTILTFKDAGGLWYEDRFRPYVSMVFNLTSNIILVQFIGIYGVVVSTILAFFISLPWCNYVVFKNMFQKSAFNNLLIMLMNFAITSLVCALTYLICSVCHNGAIGLVEKIIVCCVIPNVIYYVVYHKRDEFLEMFSLLKSYVRR